MSANQVRAKIRQYINSGEMKVGEFQDKLGVKAGSYGRFMGQNGPDKGMGSETFWAAAKFFKQREIAGVKMPSASRKKAKTTGFDSAEGTTTAAKALSKKDQLAALEREHDVSDVHLPGEENDEVPVYDTCDMARTKISRFMRESPVSTNASFIRLINAALPANSEMQGTARQMTTFLNGKGPTKGAESNVFYTSYVFFEKMRVKQGKPKNKKRQEMEAEWGPEGMRLRDTFRHAVWAFKGDSVREGKYGELQISSRK